MNLHDLIAAIEKRKKDGNSINDLVDEILTVLINVKPPEFYFIQRMKRLTSEPANVPGELKKLGLTGDDFASVARAAGKM
jgi:hypothetical protein